MAMDLFAPKLNGHHYLKPLEDPFRWVVAMFSADGAIQTIRRAHEYELKTYFPIRFNAKMEPIALFRNYLFIEHRENVTLDICRATTHFIKVLSRHDEDGILRPILVRRNAIEEDKAMVLAGRFNERSLVRRFYGKGSIVLVLDGVMANHKVKLLEDVLPKWKGDHK